MVLRERGKLRYFIVQAIVVKVSSNEPFVSIGRLYGTRNALVLKRA